MAHIPYGYEIINGRAECKSSEVNNIRSFIRYYLGGLSIMESRKMADIPLSLSGAKRILDNPVYVGDGYYPPIYSKETAKKLAAERKRRRAAPGSFTGNKACPPITVFHTFTVISESEAARNECPREVQGSMSEPARMAAAAYSRIRPAKNGERKMNPQEQRKLLRLMNRELENYNISSEQG